MLRSLSIKNIALIEDITIGFTGGMNCLTGETGAGKSIIIDSIGALLGSRVVIGLGSVIYVLQAGYSIYVYIMNMQQDLPDEGKKGFRSLIITTALMLLAFLFLALACFIKRSDLALCIFAVVLFVVWFFVRRGQLPDGAAKWPLQLVLTAAGSVLGTILSALLFAVRKKKVEA